MLHDVFLDFFNRDSREIYGFDKLPNETHLAFLVEALTVAVFLCRDHCILPPGFLAESKLGREALIIRRGEYLHERLVRLSLKEYSLDEFWDKKEHQYEPFREKYEGLFDPKNHELLRSVSRAIIPRTSRIADAITTGWQNAPDANPIWRDRIRGLKADEVERLRKIPLEILDSGIAITWPAIAARIHGPLVPSELRPVLQNVYFSAYLAEYDLKVITNLPYTSHPFVSTGKNLAYDYEALKAALAAGGLWDIIRGLATQSIIHLRQRAEYLRFREAFDAIAAGTDQLSEVRRIFTFAAQNDKPQSRFLSLVLRNAARIVFPHGVELREQEIDEIAQRLGSLAAAANEIADQLKSLQMQVTMDRRNRVAYSAKPKEVAVFVALEMERKVLIERWNLQAQGREQIWRGRLNGVQIFVFGRDEMGRVPAAVATMQMLSHCKPDILIVAGIAGGFTREKVALGNILIGSDIVDLASRKVIYEGTETSIEFRPRQFRTDDRLEKYLKASFKVDTWQSNVTKDAEWPDDRRPAIHYGLIASLDEVVADTNFVDKLCDAWPKLLGIEMEAGGVCAAAETFNIKPAVIRGVSDLADPSKSDNEWRRRAIKTVAHLIESLDFDALLAD